ncbi:SMI1/KNR4 family protein [Streptomyces sp. ME02-6991-2A]|uniref:SMI1/KNR4 family protein n=1 Tax=Streptomyces sp. ME02-6991-2A TaxID=3028677 RepID=UPI0029BC092C|nr:SMI1/KNR4 family protein [Streptomyces sp. ME02-6991-2A]MDX3379769.1 SMI1/KNR4 family protein [Streptomyces sp. ME02-6991-2A]
MRNRNIVTDHLSAVMAMLGPAPNRHVDPAAWDRLHAELGIRLPADYQVLVDAYAPVQLNRHLYLHHPATERWNLGQQIRGTVRAWSEVEWDGLDPDEDPRLLFGLEELSFGTPQGLWPIASTDRGETVFLVAAGTAAPWLLVEDGEERWARYDMGFAEWLHRYLVGEDMGGPDSSAHYPGPVRLCRLPMTVDDRPEPWSGPERGM